MTAPLARLKEISSALNSGYDPKGAASIVCTIRQDLPGIIKALEASSPGVSAGGEPGAWQWRYVGEHDHEWKTPSGGRKITPEELKREQPIEQRPLYATLPPSNQPGGEPDYSQHNAEIVRLNKMVNACDVLQRIAAEQSSDPATDDLTVPLAMELAEAKSEIARLYANPPGDVREKVIEEIAAQLKAQCGAGERCSCAEGNWQWHDHGCDRLLGEICKPFFCALASKDAAATAVGAHDCESPE